MLVAGLMTMAASWTSLVPYYVSVKALVVVATVVQPYKVLAVARCRAQHTRAGRNRDVLVQVYHFTGILSSNQLDLS